MVFGTFIGRYDIGTIFLLIQGFGAFAQGKSGFKRLYLFHEIIDQIARQDFRKCRNVVYGFLGIDFRALSTGLGQRIDQMAFQFQQSGFEYGEKSGWAGAYND